MIFAMEGLLLGRALVRCAPDAHCLGVVQWNILADSLSDAFPRVDKRLLRWEHRFPLLLAELRRFLSRGWIVACEELEHYSDFERELGDVADCAFAQKLVDGCALFVPRATGRIVKSERRVLLEGESSRVALLARVSLRDWETELPVAVTHLKAKVGFEELRRRQSLALCDALEQWKRPDDVGMVVAGDWNDEPHSPACEAMRQRGYVSAYAAVLGAEPHFTTSKIRDTLAQHTIDYVWYVGGLRPVDCLAMPAVPLLEPTHLPLVDFPSDHLSLCAIFVRTSK